MYQMLKCKKVDRHDLLKKKKAQVTLGSTPSCEVITLVSCISFLSKQKGLEEASHAYKLWNSHLKGDLNEINEACKARK